MTALAFGYNIVITMKQQVVRVGNSVGVIIPKALKEQMGLEAGTTVVVEPAFGGRAILISKQESDFGVSFDNQKLAALIEKVNRLYSTAFKELANNH